jgi:asparaginyl-tRNA synthetase
MVEPEVAYATLDDITELAEGLVVEVVARVLERRRRELTVLERDTTSLERVVSPFPRVTYDEAAALLKAKGLPFEWGGDFGSPDETAISEAYDRPVAVTGYPSAVKAFYFKPHPDRPEVSLSVDVLAPDGYGEIIGGGQRIDDYDMLMQRLAEHNLPVRDYEWYLDLRRFGSVPHAGFGMGIERVVSWICGLEHLREAIPYPRMLHRLTP